MSTLVFSVIDTTCEAADQTYYPPRVRLVTRGTTTKRMRVGFPEYVPATGALYKTLTYQGTALQVAQTWPDVAGGIPPRFCGGLSYQYSGASQIDIFGKYTSRHQKNLSVACTKGPPWPQSFTSPDPFWSELWGYCWAPDPASCPACNSDPSSWQFKGDYSNHSPFDYPNMVMFAQVGGTSTPTTLAYHNSNAPVALTLQGVNNFPLVTVNGLNAHWIEVTSQSNWSATLSDEFTVADEIASQQIVHTNAPIAENMPAYTSYTFDSLVHVLSRFTTVDFDLVCENLIPNKAYVVTVEFRNPASGVGLIQPYAFTATLGTYTITDTVPNPNPGQRLEVRNPQINFGAPPPDIEP